MARIGLTRDMYTGAGIAGTKTVAGRTPCGCAPSAVRRTGQLSRRIVALGVHVVAVEPADNMRAVLATNLPDVRSVPGTAERIPLADGGADAVVVGNAFHHFDAESAFAQIRRVLKPGGALALFWARTDEDTANVLACVDQWERSSNDLTYAIFAGLAMP